MTQSKLFVKNPVVSVESTRTMQLYAWETLWVWDAVFNEIIPDKTLMSLATMAFWDNSARARISQPFFGSGVSWTTMTLFLAKFWSPTQNLWVRIEWDSSVAPNNTPLTNWTVSIAPASVLWGTQDDWFTLISNVSQTASFGYRIQFTANGFLTTVTKNSNCTANRCIVRDDAGNILFTATFSGNTATFTPYYVASGTFLRIEADSSWSSYTRAIATWISYPQVRWAVTYNTSSTWWANGTWTEAYNIDSIFVVAEQTITFPGSVTCPVGQRHRLSMFQWIYGSETIDWSNHYICGTSTVNSATRIPEYWNWTARVTPTQANNITETSTFISSTLNPWIVMSQVVVARRTCSVSQLTINWSWWTRTRVFNSNWDLIATWTGTTTHTFATPVILEAWVSYTFTVDNGSGWAGSQVDYNSSGNRSAVTLNNIILNPHSWLYAIIRTLTTTQFWYDMLGAIYSTMLISWVAAECCAAISYKRNELWFAASAVSAQSLATISTAGVMNWYSWQIIGADAYLWNTPWSVVSVAPFSSARSIGKFITSWSFRYSPFQSWFKNNWPISSISAAATSNPMNIVSAVISRPFAFVASLVPTTSVWSTWVVSCALQQSLDWGKTRSNLYNYVGQWAAFTDNIIITLAADVLYRCNAIVTATWSISCSISLRYN